MSAAKKALDKGYIATHPLRLGGRQRSFFYYYPYCDEPTSPLPAVLALHGSYSSARAFMEITALNEMAAKSGFVAVYPSMCYTMSYTVSHQEARRDAAFIKRVLKSLEKTALIDMSKIYATGFSSGADILHYFASRKDLACLFKGFAPVCSNIEKDWGESVNHDLPVNMLMLNGSLDRFNRWEGNPPRWLSAKDGFDIWSKHNGAEKIEADNLPFLSTVSGFVHGDNEGGRVKNGAAQNRNGQDTDLIFEAATNAKTGAQVILGKIEGGGHTWPGAQNKHGLLDMLVGRTHQKHSAGEIIWSFFESLQ